ncbi:class I SAM-dependent methyltransferase [Pontivivens ytuae]|uniref:Class I SAM-dependent methyltransferase n=1 Tax=Pontivivens ytuae TaxID=2789856 RepID=A0A7S9LPR9_9RHOB|nr:class I SAM-dependent methyltransferase [Pontivivens ytuae]QPH52993.1 class I SAM-dependent methyltransferase [Pontivivens ytuae]
MPDPAGASFKAADVVDLYTHRPPYAPKIYEYVVEHALSTGRLLDLGCGEGKVARPMARVFGHVTAVDPSANMIALGQSLENGAAENLEWIEATAEDAPLVGAFDAVTFASSIHWMDPARLFPKLADHLNASHVLAIIGGDEAFAPPWHDEWRRFLARWVPEITGLPLDSEEWRASRRKHLDYVDVVDSTEFVSDPFRQTVESFILCQHSRDTFALHKMGDRRVEFDRELEALLRPHADGDGELTFRVKTKLTLATLRTM